MKNQEWKTQLSKWQKIAQNDEGMAAQSQTKKKSTKGRKPIVYSNEDLERDPFVMLIIGEMGVGKTFRTNLEIKYYMKDNPEKGKKGRKVLAFDTNGHDYPTFRTVSPNYIKALTKVAARRILPFKKGGKAMSNIEKREVAEKIVNHFKNGLIVLDDTDSYMTGAKGQSLIGALTTVRHKGIDILFSHQSLGKVTTTQFQACTWIRLHHQVDPVTKYKERIPNYSIVRIAQLIVNEQYDLCSRAMDEGKFKTESEYKKQRSFFVYIDMRRRKVSGCTRAAYIRACKRFIDQEEKSTIRMMLNELDFYNKPIYKDRNAAIIKLISDYLRYHDDKILSPVLN